MKSLRKLYISISIVGLLLISIIFWRYDFSLLFENYKPILYNEHVKPHLERKIQHVYVVNMKNNPDRYKKISSELNSEGIKFSRFNAIDGYNLKIISKSGEIFTGKDLKSGKAKLKMGEKYKVYCPNVVMNYRYIPKMYYAPLVAGEFGCYCSHLEIMHDVIEKGYNAVLILEDDAEIYKGVAQKIKKLEQYLPDVKKWDIIYTGLSMRKNSYGYFRKFQPVIRNPEIKRITKFPLKIWGTYSFIINYSGATKILSEIESSGIYDPIDLNLYRVMSASKLNAFFADNVNIGHDYIYSDIDIMGRKSGFQHQKQVAYLN